MKVVKSKQVKKYIDSQDSPTQKRLNAALNRLPDGDVVPVVGLKDTFRVRVGDFRAIFVKEQDIIRGTVMDARGQIYRKGAQT